MARKAPAGNVTIHDIALNRDESLIVFSRDLSRTDEFGDGRQLLPFMGFEFYERISDEDLELIVEYIKTFPPAEATPPVAGEEH